MKIVLVRHTSVGVRKGTCYGWSDVPLAESFPEEAQRTYETLRALVGKDENASTLNNCFDAVYCSPLLVLGSWLLIVALYIRNLMIG